jgi:hypothetical protein
MKRQTSLNVQCVLSFRDSNSALPHCPEDEALCGWKRQQIARVFDSGRQQNPMMTGPENPIVARLLCECLKRDEREGREQRQAHVLSRSSVADTT